MIVFFDGVCGLCNNTVDFLLPRTGPDVKFAPLQGATASSRLPASDVHELNSLVVVEGARIFRKSDAALRALRACGGAWPALARIGLLAPRFARDGVYSWIARHRYSWFGKRDTCRLPSADERIRFLD